MRPAAQIAPSVSLTGPPAIPDHDLLQPIASGSYGEVWLGRNAVGTLRAVKIVRRQTFDKDTHYEREFKGLQKFEPISRSHPGLIQILHLGRAADHFYYIMELADNAADPSIVAADGRLTSENADISESLLPSAATSNYDSRTASPSTVEDDVRRLTSKSGIRHCPSGSDQQSAINYTPRTLRHDLTTRGALPLPECLQIAQTLAAALEHLHSHNLVHRDIKPSNIIFINGAPKLADIGLVADINATISFVGTAGYLPPEGPGKPAGDIYSLGKVLYEMAVGRDRAEFPALPENWRDFAGQKGLLEINAIITKACAWDPAQRYQSVHELGQDLALLDRGGSVRREHLRAHNFQSATKLLRASGVAVLLALSAYSLWSWKASSGALGTVDPLEGAANREAYYKYIQGRAAMRQRHRQGLSDGLNLMSEAVQLDPKFLRAWAELFMNYLHGRWTGIDVLARQREIARTIEQLQPNSAEAALTKAWLAYVNFELGEAEAGFRRAIAIDPTRLHAHSLYAAFLIARGRLTEGRAELDAVEKLDPAYWLAPNLRGDCHYFERDYARAHAQYAEALRLADQNIGTFERLTRLHEAQQQFDAAIDTGARSRIAAGEDPARVADESAEARRAFLKAGENGYWPALLEQRRRKSTSETQPFEFALLHAHLGETNQALVLLERAWQIKDRNLLINLRNVHCWDSLRGNPRFERLCRDIGYIPPVVSVTR